MTTFLNEWAKASLEEQDNCTPELDEGLGNGGINDTSLSTIDPIIV